MKPQRALPPIEPLAPGACAHHWIVDGDNNGTCKRCGAARHFNSPNLESSAGNGAELRKAHTAPLGKPRPLPISDLGWEQ